MKNILGRERETNAKGEKPLQHNGTVFKESVARETWLHYFNDYLRQHGIITEEEWRKMRQKIG